jgi:outer membrane protein assembly factor BamB
MVEREPDDRFCPLCGMEWEHPEGSAVVSQRAEPPGVQRRCPLDGSLLGSDRPPLCPRCGAKLRYCPEPSCDRVAARDEWFCPEHAAALQTSADFWSCPRGGPHNSLATPECLGFAGMPAQSWSWKPTGEAELAPFVVSAATRLIVLEDTGSVHAFPLGQPTTGDAEPAWSVALAPAETPTVGPVAAAGKVWVPDGRSAVAMLDVATGEREDTLNLGELRISAPPTATGQLVAVGCETPEGDGTGVVLDLGTRHAVRVQLRATPYEPPLILDTQVVFSAFSGHQAFEATTGRPAWSLEVSAPLVGHAAALDDGDGSACIVWSDAEGAVNCIRAGETRPLWTERVGPMLAFGPSTAPDGVYVPDGTNVACLAQSDGGLIARYSFPDRIASSASVGRDVIAVTGAHWVGVVHKQQARAAVRQFPGGRFDRRIIALSDGTMAVTASPGQLRVFAAASPGGGWA